MARKHVKVYYDEKSDFKKRLEKACGPYSETVFCMQAIEKAIEQKERKGKK